MQTVIIKMTFMLSVNKIRSRILTGFRQISYLILHPDLGAGLLEILILEEGTETRKEHVS